MYAGDSCTLHRRRKASPAGRAPRTASSHPAREDASARYPLLLDELILRDFAMYLGMILVSFMLLTLVFTFFELLGDIFATAFR